MKIKKITIYCMSFALIVCICSGFLCNVNYNVFADTELSPNSKASILIDKNTQTVMYENNADAMLPIASMAKMMSLLLIFEDIQNGKLDFQDKVLTSTNASGMGGSQAFIDPYEEYEAKQLILSIVVASANDSVVAMAEHLSGSEEIFVDRMNNRAAELNMKNTLYANATGLPAPENYSCARDCATVLSTLCKIDEYKDMCKVWMFDFVHPSGRITQLTNTNKLVRYYTACNGGKTGFTNEAGHCLSCSAVKNGLELISVVIGANSGQNRFKDTTAMLDYGFANYENKLIVDKGNATHNDILFKNAKYTTKVYPKNNYYLLCKKGEENECMISYKLYDEKAPLESDKVVGEIVISKNGVVIDKVMLVVKDEVESRSFYDNVKHIVSFM